jgi:hypothetical protein
MGLGEALAREVNAQPIGQKATSQTGELGKGTVDLYSASINWQVAESCSGLTSGTHTIVVTVLGTLGPGAEPFLQPLPAITGV